MSTIVQVAELAGVSIATVSNVIRGTRKVTHETRAKVESAIRALNYSPNEIARSLKVKQTRMIVFVLPDITNPFFPEIMRGAEDAAFERGYFLLCANTNEQSDRERRIVTALRSYRVAGVLLASAEVAPRHGYSRIAHLVQSGTSVVCLDRALSDVSTDAVLLDNVRGASECVTHLIEQGHTRIGMISGPRHLQTGAERLEGYKLSLRRAGIRVSRSLIAEGDFRSESGKRCALELLRQEPRPTALFVANGVMTLGALEALEQMGLRCPDDIALATFDEIAAHSLHPLVTAVLQPSYKMGRKAAEILMDRVEGRLKEGVMMVRVAPELLIRESTLHRPEALRKSELAAHD